MRYVWLQCALSSADLLLEVNLMHPWKGISLISVLMLNKVIKLSSFDWKCAFFFTMYILPRSQWNYFRFMYLPSYSLVFPSSLKVNSLSLKKIVL